jgi:ferric-dicitrate binding protein FerR (iron transport regulator)
VTDRSTKVSEDRVLATYRSLAEEYASKRQAAEADRAWASIAARQKLHLRRSGSRRWTIALGFAAACAVAAISIWLTTPKAPGLRYEVVGATARDGAIRTGDNAATLEFSDGSRIQTDSHTNVSVDVLGARSVSARLSSGKLRVNVRHSPNTDWRFVAGPYEVRVVGTVFDLSWDPARSRLSVVMYEGRVQVVLPGPSLKTISAGETLVLPAEPAPVPRAAAETSLTAPRAVQAAPVAPAPPAPPAPPGRTNAVTAGAATSWAKLVSTGRFDEVVRAAEELGIQVALDTKGAPELKALAQASRYTGRTGLAVQTWKLLRSRFADTTAGRQAAFFLGRIYDQDGQPQEAVRWLNAYLVESSSDVYASEALGRKLLLVRRLSGTVAAAPLAREYLARFPSGAYAQSARDMLDE